MDAKTFSEILFYRYEKWYLKSEINNFYDTIELTDFYSYIEQKTKLEKENTLKNVFFI